LKKRNWLGGRVGDKKVGIYCQTKRIFAGHSSATVKKIAEG
jgi:hypothetical protein